MDQVIDAIITGRPSVFDSPKHLNQSHITEDLNGVPPDTVEYHDEAKAIMHCMVRIPRLACWIRRASSVPTDIEARDNALALAKAIWESLPTAMLDTIVQTATAQMDAPPVPEIEDIMPKSLSFVSVRALTICTKFWSLEIYTSSLLQTMWDNFGSDCEAAELPAREALYEVDISAARNILQSLPFTLLSSRYLPIVPLRILGPLSFSVGSWYRLAQRLKARQNWLHPSSPSCLSLDREIADAIRIEDCAVEQCNRIHESWRVGRVPKSRFEMMIPVMAGGEMPEWMPNKVDWEQARARMVRQGIVQ